MPHPYKKKRSDTAEKSVDSFTYVWMSFFRITENKNFEWSSFERVFKYLTNAKTMRILKTAGTTCLIISKVKLEPQ